MNESQNNNEQIVSPEMLIQAIEEDNKEALKRVKFGFWVLAGLQFLFLVALIILLAQPKQPVKVLTVDRDGNVTQIAAYNTVPTNPEIITNRATNAFIELLNFNHLNYQERLDDSEELFLSADYHQDFVSKIKASPWFQTMLDNKMDVSGVVVNEPVILNPKGNVSSGGLQYWVVSLPVALFMEGPGVRPVQIERNIEVTLVHTRQYKYEQGIALATINTGSR